jgi:predicted PurR-regulated permease PerM
MVVLVAVLFFAREVFIPLALAVLLAFLLAPLAHRLRQWGLWQVPSVLIVVLLSFILVGIIGTVMVSQLTDLAHKLPEYQENFHKKLQAIGKSGGGVVMGVTRWVHDIGSELTPAAPAGRPQQSKDEKPVPVEIRHSNFSPMEIIQKLLGSTINVLMTGVIVIVFVIFILIQEADLRDRLIRLAGTRRVNVTNKVLDDAAGRVSRYLQAQLMINAGYGVLAGFALYFAGVPNPLLWGMMATLLRYVPYVGIWIAAIMPAAVAFAIEPGWGKMPVIFGLYFGIDLLMYNFAEPLLYGNSTGVIPLAILVATLFWAWLWGPVGLLLSTPLTVLVVVIGRHVPNLEFLSLLLSDEPAPRPNSRFHRRLQAMVAKRGGE